MTSRVNVINGALIKLGAATIASPADESEQARKAALVFDDLARAEIRKQAWSFAMARVALAANVAAPVSYFPTAYALPTDFLRLVQYGDYWVYDMQVTTDPITPIENYSIEGGELLSQDTGALYIRYLRDLSGNISLWDATFVEAFKVRLAMELAPTLTKNRIKKQDLAVEYKDAIREAKRCNAIERGPEQIADGGWVLGRLI